MAIVIKKLVLKNFRSFLGEHTVNFPPAGLVILKGENRDSGGQSGAGKSTILHAVCYALGYAPYSAKSLQCWDSEDPVSVELYLETPQGEVVITRGEKLTLTVNGEPIKGAAKAIEQSIDQICGVNATLRAALTYRGQKKPGLFLSMTDSEKKEFFVDVLGLHWVEEFIEKSSKAIQDIEKSLDKAVVEHQSAEKVLAVIKEQDFQLITHDTAELESEIRALTNKKLEDERALVVLQSEYEQAKKAEFEEAEKIKSTHLDEQLRLHARVNELKKAIDAVSVDDSEKSRLEALLKRCKQGKLKLEADVKADAARKDAAIAALQTEAEIYTRQVGELPSLERRLSIIAKEITTLTTNTCPTCGQEWVEHQNKLRELSDTKTAMELKQKELMELGPRIQSLKAQMAELKAETNADRDAQIEKYQKAEETLTSQLVQENLRLTKELGDKQRDMATELASLKEVVKNIADKSALECQIHLNNPVNKSKILESKLRESRVESGETIKTLANKISQLKVVNLENSENTKRHQKIQEQISNNQAVVSATADMVDKLRTYLAEEKDFNAMLKGFLAVIFDETLSEITDETNATLGVLPNVAHMTIQFVSNYQTQKGTNKQAIVPLVTFNGDEHPLDSGCSGGMETSVELAVDLAIANVVSRRTGASLGFLMLDESFNGHDQVTKEACLEMLSKYAASRLIMIVDHGAEMKECFTQTIEVDYRNGHSSII